MIKKLYISSEGDNDIFLIGANASTNTIRLLGYSIRGSTNSLISDTKVCYSDNSGILPTVIEAGCKVLARYIWFYQTKSQSGEVPILEICEVQVFGMVIFLHQYLRQKYWLSYFFSWVLNIITSLKFFFFNSKCFRCLNFF